MKITRIKMRRCEKWQKTCKTKVLSWFTSVSCFIQEFLYRKQIDKMMILVVFGWRRLFMSATMFYDFLEQSMTWNRTLWHWVRPLARASPGCWVDGWKDSSFSRRIQQCIQVFQPDFDFRLSYLSDDEGFKVQSDCADVIACLSSNVLFSSSSSSSSPCWKWLLIIISRIYNNLYLNHQQD